MSKSTTTMADRAAEPLSLAQMRRAPTHPGEVFRLDYREPIGISQAEAARQLGVPANRLNEIEVGKRPVTVDTALRFEALTGSSAEFWLTLQARHDLWHARKARKNPLEPLLART